jgi:hypothetical protein
VPRNWAVPVSGKLYSVLRLFGQQLHCSSKLFSHILHTNMHQLFEPNFAKFDSRTSIIFLWHAELPGWPSV